MMILIHLFSLWQGVPTLLKYFGLMKRDVVALAADGTEWSPELDFTTEPIYTAQKPADAVAALSAASVFFSLRSLFS